MQTATCNIVIIGGGLTGFSLALLLANIGKTQVRQGLAPWKTILIDNNPAPQFSNDNDHQNPDKHPLRVSAINDGVIRHLNKAGLNHNPLNACPIKSMAVSEMENTALLTISSEDIGLENMAHVIENKKLVFSLYAAIKQNPFIDIRFNTTLDRTKRISEEQSQLWLSDQTQLVTDLIVGADGQQSKVRQLAGIEVKTSMPSEAALIANCLCEQPHKNIARQTFMRDSILAFLPITSNNNQEKMISIVWSGKPCKLNSLLTKTASEFSHALEKPGNNLSNNTLGAIKLSSKISSIKIQPKISQQSVKENIILIGDAAHSLHPLAGQGANLGISDCIKLAHHLSQAWRKKIPLGNIHWNRRYERSQRAEASKLTRAIKSIKYSYQTNYWLYSLIHQIGISTINQSSFIKSYLMDEIQELGNGVRSFS